MSPILISLILVLFMSNVTEAKMLQISQNSWTPKISTFWAESLWEHHAAFKHLNQKLSFDWGLNCNLHQMRIWMQILSCLIWINYDYLQDSLRKHMKFLLKIRTKAGFQTQTKVSHGLAIQKIVFSQQRCFEQSSGLRQFFSILLYPVLDIP